MLHERGMLCGAQHPSDTLLRRNGGSPNPTTTLRDTPCSWGGEDHVGHRFVHQLAAGPQDHDLTLTHGKP